LINHLINPNLYETPFNLAAADEKDKDKRKKETKNAKAAEHFSLNNKSVKIYPDPFKREMHVVSKENKTTQFFVFDSEGTMVVNRPLKENEHIKLTGLKRGYYTYHLFDGDEEKVAGKFEIR
jgi:Secretion system C-terminal sorting domain